MRDPRRPLWGWWHLAQAYRRLMVAIQRQPWRRHRHKGKSREARGEG